MENDFVEIDIKANVVLIEGNLLAFVEAKIIEVSNSLENTNCKGREESSNWLRNVKTSN